MDCSSRSRAGHAGSLSCDEQSDWYPSVTDIAAKIPPRTKALVIINPNNPTGAVYTKEILTELIELARRHKLIVFADEIYSKILYDDACHIPIATLCDDLLIVSFSGLSKAYRLAGFRSGWMVISGDKNAARDYILGLEILSNMRLCANVPAQLAKTAPGGYGASMNSSSRRAVTGTEECCPTPADLHSRC